MPQSEAPIAAIKFLSVAGVQQEPSTFAAEVRNPASNILRQMREAHAAVTLPAAERRKKRAYAVVNAFEEERRGTLDERVRLVVARPPKIESDNFTAYALFPGSNGKPHFFPTDRRALGDSFNSDYVDFLALHSADIRSETPVERQKRLLLEIKRTDALISNFSGGDSSGIAFLLDMKNNAVLAYLRASLALERAYPDLSSLFDVKQIGTNIDLIMGQPRETNLPQRLADRSVDPIVEDADNDFVTRLHRKHLLNRTGFEIYTLLELSPFTLPQRSR